MKSLTINKDEIDDLITEFIDNIDSNELKIKFDKKRFVIQKNEEASVLDLLISQAADLGPEDLSINVDHYLYGLSKKRN